MLTQVTLGSFLKLCKIKYYNFSPVYNVQPNFSFQSGDPIGPEAKGSDGGSSIWSLPDGTTKHATRPERMTFKPEISTKRKHSERGTVSMATTVSKTNPDERFASSQFIITLSENIEDLDGKAAIFGEVVEGFDALEKINSSFIDSSGRPLQDIRILHTVVLDDPYDDPTGMIEPPSSPLPSDEQRATVRIAYDEVLEENANPEKLEKIRREREARAQALTLELIGDLPSADITPPEQILFVCKLNPVTQDEDLELIFSRFGKILSCEVIRDKTTGDSLQYAFIEFATKEDCERAYFKMQGVLIDDHRIHVDFSQSVSKLSASWQQGSKRGRGGFGGIDSLEQRKQYRGEEGARSRGDRYDYVFDKSERAIGTGTNLLGAGTTTANIGDEGVLKDVVAVIDTMDGGDEPNPVIDTIDHCALSSDQKQHLLTSPALFLPIQFVNTKTKVTKITDTMPSESKVLVYHHRHDAANPIVPDGLAIMAKADVDDILQKHDQLQRSSKPIARGSLNVDIYERDLLTDVQKPQWAGMPNYESNVAGISVPWKVFLGKLVGSKEFDDLVILSAKR
ncbi:hypothetical protein Q7P37_004556 [Cladosporium fusiforme]